MAHFYPVVAHNEDDLNDYAKKRAVIILETSDKGAINKKIEKAKSNRLNSTFSNALLFLGVVYLPILPIAGVVKIGDFVLKKVSDKHLLDNYKASKLIDGRILLVDSKVVKLKKDTIDGINGKETPAKYIAKLVESANNFERHIKAKDEFCIIAQSKIFDEVEKLIKTDSSVRDKQLVKRNGYKIIFDYTQKVVFAVKEEFDADREKINTNNINQKVLLKF